MGPVNTQIGLSARFRGPGTHGSVHDWAPSAVSRGYIVFRCTGSSPSRYEQTSATVPGSPPRSLRRVEQQRVGAGKDARGGGDGVAGKGGRKKRGRQLQYSDVARETLHPADPVHGFCCLSGKECQLGLVVLEVDDRYGVLVSMYKHPARPQR